MSQGLELQPPWSRKSRQARNKSVNTILLSSDILLSHMLVHLTALFSVVSIACK